MPVCKQKDMSSGFISSVSRRMTTLMFGGGNNQVFHFSKVVEHSPSLVNEAAGRVPCRF